MDPIESIDLLLTAVEKLAQATAESDRKLLELLKLDVEQILKLQNRVAELEMKVRELELDMDGKL